MAVVCGQTTVKIYTRKVWSWVIKLNSVLHELNYFTKMTRKELQIKVLQPQSVHLFFRSLREISGHPIDIDIHEWIHWKRELQVFSRFPLDTNSRETLLNFKVCAINVFLPECCNFRGENKMMHVIESLNTFHVTGTSSNKVIHNRYNNPWSIYILGNSW